MILPYIKLAEVGHCDTERKNRTVGSIGYSGKIVADEKRPMFSLAGVVIRELVTFVRYESKDQFDEDMATLKALIDRLEFKEPSEPEKD